MNARLDPDRLAALEEERRFLLKSLDDLELEFAAGDIDEVDFNELRDDYTLRVADAQRSIDEQRNLVRRAPKASRGRTLAWVVGLAALGLLAGFMIAQASGNRLLGETGSGGTRTSNVTKLAQAQALFPNRDDWGDAIDLYDQVIDDDPVNVEAITYRSWLLYRQGEIINEAIDNWEEATRLDPTYSDALVFRTIALSDVGRYDEANEVLGLFDASEPNEQLVALVSQQGLRSEILGETLLPTIEAGNVLSLDELDLSVEDALGVAGYLAFNVPEGGPLSAVKLYDAILAAEPDNALALARSALIFAQSGIVDLALARAADARDLAPEDPEVLLAHAFVFSASDTEAACDSLDVLDELTDVAPAIADPAASLRAQVCG